MLGGLEGPIIALYLAALAGNKVEGLALSKGIGIFMLAPIVGIFTESWWKHLAGIIPFYWPVQALASLSQSGQNYWVFIVLGILVHAFYIWLLLALFNRRIT